MWPNYLGLDLCEMQTNFLKSDLRWMRLLFTFALTSLGITCITPSYAADLSARWSNSTPWSIGRPALPVVIYDYQPGVDVRPYWVSPWNNHHYFPATGRRPRVGRREYFSLTRPAPKPATTFHREWSTSSALEPALDSHAEQTASSGHIIHAEAEVTIIGPDEMNIHVFRRDSVGNAQRE